MRRDARERTSVRPTAAAWFALGALALSACANLSGAPSAGVHAEAVEDSQPRSIPEELEAGDRMRDSGRLPEALLAYMRAYHVDTSDGGPRERIAYLHLRKDPDRALKILTKLARDKPNSPSLHRGIGFARLALGDLEQAEASLTRSLELDPNSGAAHSALGVIYDQLGVYDEAKDHYWKAMMLSPEDYEIPNNLGVSYMMTGDYSSAYEIFQEALRLNPDDLGVRNNLGLSLGMLGRYDEALQVFSQIGDETAALNNLGYVYFLNERYTDAIAHYKRALLVRGGEKAAVLHNLEDAQRALELRRGPTPEGLAAP